MKKLIITIMLMITTSSSFSQFVFTGDILSYKKDKNVIEFKLDNSIINLYVIKPNIIRFRFTNKENFSEAPSYAVIFNGKETTYNFEDQKDFFEISTSEMIVRISKKPCRISIFDKNMNLINEDEKSFGVAYDQNEVRCYKKLFDDERFYGLGEKAGSLLKNGNQYTMWNSDTPGYDSKSDPLYQSIPFFIGIRNHKAYGIFLDDTYKSYFNMGAANNRFYWFGAENRELDYYFIYGPEIKKVISSYTDLTGRMHLPPKWALGYQQSKWSYYPEYEVRDIAKNFRERQIPCDVIYLDIHYMNGYRVFTWNKDRFPNPQKMLSDLHKEGFKVVTIIDPGVKADTTDYSIAKEGLEKNLFVKYPDGVLYEGQVWPSWAYFPDFTKKETRDWWGSNIANLLSEGVSGIWNDMNEPSVWGKAFPDMVQFNDNGFGANHKKIHNVYGLEMARATYNGIKKAYPDRRPFILTRAGFAGIQRYAAVWTGDNVSNEESLQLACTMPQGMGISGIPFCGSDVGGFIGYPSQDLYLRWIELGAFTPFYRGHSELNEPNKEPWAFGEDIEKWARDIITLRYELLPYLYNEFYNASQTGLPIMRPMFLEYQNDEECYSDNAQYQFMFGDNILVAPVLSAKENFKKLYLPKGKWMDWWTSKIYDGNQWIIMDAPVWKIPLFLKEGGIVPMEEKQDYVGEKDIKELTLKIFPSDSSTYTLYEDDGITTNYQKGDYLLTKFDLTKDNNETKLSVSKLHNGYKNKRIDYFIHFYNCDSVSYVKLNNKQLQSFQSLNKLENSDEGFSFDKNSNCLSVKVKDSGEFILTYGN
jgi:alpha-glucosidase